MNVNGFELVFLTFFASLLVISLLPERKASGRELTSLEIVQAMVIAERKSGVQVNLGNGG